MILRDFQQRLKQRIYYEWQTKRNVLAVLPTGGGKTAIFSNIIQEHQGVSGAIAHRQELVSQISLSLTGYGVRHQIIAPKNLVKEIVNLQQLRFGRTCINPNSTTFVAGVDTLVRRSEQLRNLLTQTTLWVQDEGHHVLKTNKWGKVIEMMPNARGLGVTATPTRADGYGLGSHADGYYDTMVEGATMSELITEGWLTDYRVICDTSNINIDSVEISKTTGDFNKSQLRTAVNDSDIVGDVVESYLKFAKGKTGVTFAPTIEVAEQINNKFNTFGVPSAILTAKTKPLLRMEIIRRLERRELLQLVNVDICGEGFDLPAIEVVSMARHTASYGLFAQQFGRALRPVFTQGMPLDTAEQRKAACTKKAIIIDHVGNIIRHNGTPERPRYWSLDRREKRGAAKESDDILFRVCKNEKCLAPYERIYKQCPYCGEKYQPADRSEPKFVDGDLIELDADALAMLRGAVAKADITPNEAFTNAMHATGNQAAAANVRKHHIAKQQAQVRLRDSMQWWAGYQQALGRDLSESWRRFYHMFGVDAMTAQTLNAKDSQNLNERLQIDIGKLGAQLQRVVL